jgi:ATP-dependent exoDNAse (exonuclease V) alpha subunit
VVGKAGTGKSTALEVARQAFEAAGMPIIGVAPTANAARQLHRSAGIESQTLDRLLVEVEHGVRQLPEGVVVILDEAGMCSTRNRLALQRLELPSGRLADRARGGVSGRQPAAPGAPARPTPLSDHVLAEQRRALEDRLAVERAPQPLGAPRHLHGRNAG